MRLRGSAVGLTAHEEDAGELARARHVVDEGVVVAHGAVEDPGIGERELPLSRYSQVPSVGPV